MDDLGEVTAVVLPSDLTGVSTRIALLLGERFPAGQAHSGAAYAMLTERQLHEEISPRRGRLIVPSTGSFGLGAAWVTRTMGYPMTAVLPSSALGARGPVFTALGAQVVVGGAGPADVLDLIDAAWAHKREGDAVLNRWNHQKYGPWVERRGKGADALRRQQDEDFWAEQRRRREAIDGWIFTSREGASPV